MSTNFEQLTSDEARNHQAGVEPTLRLLDSPKYQSIFDSEESRVGFLRAATVSEFGQLLTEINLASRGLDDPLQAIGDDRMRVESVGGLHSNPDEYVPPRMQDKKDIISYALAKAKQVDAHDAGMALGLAVNAAHIFTDGNGRTSRLVYELFSDGYSGSEDNKKRIAAIITNDAGKTTNLPYSSPVSWIAEFYATNTTFGVNPDGNEGIDYIDSEIKPFVGEWEADDIVGSESLDKSTKIQVKALLNEGQTINAAFSVFLSKHPELDIEDETTQPLVARTGKRLFVDALMPKMTQKDYDELLDITFTIKAEGVKTLIDSIAEQAPNERSKSVGHMSLRSYFVSKTKNLVSSDIRTDKPKDLR